MAKIPDQTNPLTLEDRALLQKVVQAGALTAEKIKKMQAVGMPINDADKQLEGLVASAKAILREYFGEK